MNPGPNYYHAVTMYHTSHAYSCGRRWRRNAKKKNKQTRTEFAKRFFFLLDRIFIRGVDDVLFVQSTRAHRAAAIRPPCLGRVFSTFSRTFSEKSAIGSYHRHFSFLEPENRRWVYGNSEKQQIIIYTLKTL